MKITEIVRSVAVLVLFFCILPRQSIAQSQELDRKMYYWLRYAASFELEDDWKVKAEIELRRFVFPDRQYQLFLPRIAVVRKLSRGWNFSAGILYLRQSLPKNPNTDVRLVRPEIRPYQGLTMKNKWGKLGISHRYLLEERFVRKTASGELANGYNFYFRFRYRLQLTVPLNSKNGTGQLALKLYDEIMLNFGGKIERNTFDQNRIYLGVAYQLTDRTGIQAGFLTNFIGAGNSENYLNPYILRITISQVF